LPLRIGVAAQIEHEAADRIRGILAIPENFRPIFVSGDRLVLDECGDQVVEGLPRDVVPLDGAAQRDEDGVGRFAGIHLCERVAPPCEQFEAFCRIADLVA